MKAIGRLSRVNRKAKKLVFTGAKPQRLWGHEGLGIAPSSLRRMRTAMGVVLYCY